MRKAISKKSRLVVEELEARTVMSTVPSTALVPSLFHQAATQFTTSTNWSGYAAETNFNAPANNSVSAVSGTWKVPAVTGSGTAYSSFWVGIDGYTSDTVEQIGTDSDIYNGVPSYYAWFEMYPNDSVTIPTSSLSIHVNDVVTASVLYGPKANQYTLTISDVTTSKSFSTVQQAGGLARSSAEWIVEAPSDGFSTLPLANFGSATFTSASATINGVSGAINNGGWQNTSINMVSSYTEATTSALTNSGRGFTVTYNAPPPVTSKHHHSWWWWNEANVPTPTTTVSMSLATPDRVILPQPGIALSNLSTPSGTPVISPARQVLPAPSYYFIPDVNPAGGENAPPPQDQEPLSPLSLAPLPGAGAQLNLRAGVVGSRGIDLAYFPNTEDPFQQTVYLETGPGKAHSGEYAEELLAVAFSDFSVANISLAAVFLGAYWCAPCEASRERTVVERRRLEIQEI